MGRILYSSALILLVAKIKKDKLRRNKRRNRIWTKNWLLNENFSNSALVNDLQKNSPSDFFNYTRMDRESFAQLYGLVESKIAKEDTVMRNSISAKRRLLVTLRFLATGSSYEDLKFTFGISAQAIGKIVIETCSAIIDVLQNEIKVSLCPQIETRSKNSMFHCFIIFIIFILVF